MFTLFYNKNYLKILIVFIFTTILLSCFEKDMSDEDFIKINVRFAATFMGGSYQKGLEMLNRKNYLEGLEQDVEEYLELQEDICEKYGYSLSDLEKKNEWVFSNFESAWIQRNIPILLGIATGITSTRRVKTPSTDDEWEIFFLEHERFLKK